VTRPLHICEVDESRTVLLFGCLAVELQFVRSVTKAAILKPMQNMSRRVLIYAAVYPHL